MADEANSLEDLKDLTGAAAGEAPAADAGAEVIEAAEVIEVSEVIEVVLPDPKIDAQGRSYATGKRKNAIARVWIKPGSGKVTVYKCKAGCT